MSDEELAMEIEYIDMLQTEAEQNDLLLLADRDADPDAERIEELEDLLEELEEMLLKAEEFELDDETIDTLEDAIEDANMELDTINGMFI